MHLQRNATQRNATQRNATQRNAYQNYILNNNFKFYIFQFFRAFNFLSAVFDFAKNQFAIISHCHYEGNARSNPNLIKFDFYNLISLINKFYTKWIASLIPFVRNDNFNYAFSYALKNKFEIISRNENYAFNHNKYFCRNGNNRIVSSLRGFAKTEVIYLMDCFISFAMTVTIYFLAMIMAENLFLVFGIILIVAFYLIEKLKKINLCQRIALAKENKNEENSSNNSSFAHGSKRKRFWYVWG